MMLNFLCKSSGLYVMSKKDFEPLACQILNEKQPEVLKCPMPLDVDSFILDGLFLELRDEYLSESGNILGLITFVDQRIPTYDDAFNETYIKATEGTIVVDKRLSSIPTRYRFTKAHEVSHWILHRKFYSPEKRNYNFRNKGCSYIACRQEAIDRKNPIEVKTDYDWCEWQADYLSAALLMPSVTFVPTAEQIIKSYGLSDGKLPEGNRGGILDKVSEELARLYNVSKRSVRIRLRTLDFYR